MDVDSSKCNKLDSILQYRSLELHSLTLEDLKKITNNFSDEQLLGEGGFGKVYKGVVQNGDMVAVKKLMSTMPDTKDRQFENEVHHLMRLKHPNIVQLLGYCSEQENISVEYEGKYVYAEKSEKLLWLEYLPNGNLHRHLSDESSGLDWGTRYKIMEGICNGLHYLQEEWQVTPIIHMNLKPTNILLDVDMVPKIADFGLSRLFGEDKTKTCTLNRHGTLGYMAPEYVEKGIITKMLDVFSLGVIILEMITGQKDYPEPGETGISSQEFIERVLKNWRNRLKAPGFTFQQIDCLQIRRCIQIGLACVERDRFKRPTTHQIVKMLHISVLERDYVMKFQDVITQLEKSFHDFPFNLSEISFKVREQVELVHTQLKRVKDQVHMPGDEFYNCLMSLDNHSYDHTEPAIHQRLSEKLQLKTITDLTQESLTLHERMASSYDQHQGHHAEKMLNLLKKIKDFMQTQNPEIDSNDKQRLVTVPDDFRCPVSLELMNDIIVATGQTYERVCIEKWLAFGHHTCPATQQRMASTTLTPNYVLRRLIAQWCNANGIEPPKRSSQLNKPTSVCLSSVRANIDALLTKLSSRDLEEQRLAAAELRLLAKRNTNNRICIAEAGAIPLLLSLLASSDLQTQEHAVTALLNLSIHEDNKASIISSGAVPSIVYVLKNGGMEARENAAATLFSLSVVDEYKVTIGGTGAIPALVVLLSEGSQRGKKDAAAALFNLCIYQGNKGRAIRAGLVPLIIRLVTNPTGALIDEAMAILSILSSHPEGKAAIGAAEPIPVLVEIIGSGTSRNSENAAAVILHLCGGDKPLVHLVRAEECGIMVPLEELALNGTERGKRKALQLLELMSRFLIQQEEREAQMQASAQALSQAPEQIQEADIPEQLDSPSPLIPALE